MCGFAGIMERDGSRAEGLESAVRRMSDQIAHRGPDDQGSWSDADAGVALGFRRLSILDLSHLGHQPMRSPSGRFTVVFNGEVYNHGSLRGTLEARGWRFRGHSDTEVLVAALEEWGIKAAVERFIGMFAIAVWDAELRRLSLIRDRMGIKPLFYYHRPGLLTFGSELKALVAGPEFDATLDPSAVHSYLRYLYVPAPETIYRRVRKLLPGHILTIADPTLPIPQSEAFWSLEEVAENGRARSTSGSSEERVDELDALLGDAIRLRMRSDVPLGALLSGGVDSSTVVALMQASSTRPVQTFSIGFPEHEHNELEHAARVASHLGTEHTELMLSGSDALNVIPSLPDLFDEPLGDPSQIPTYLVSRLARQAVVVALSGDGGDELFAGYNRYTRGQRMIDRLGRVPRSVRRLAATAIGQVSTESWDRSYRAVAPVLPAQWQQRLPGQKIAKLGTLLEHEGATEMYRSLLSAWQRPDRVVVAGVGSHGRVEQMLDKTRGLPLLERMLLTDQATYLADDLLAKVDRASMAVGLEVRVPLLDHRVVEFSWRVPESDKIRDGEGKWLLRQVLYRYVPQGLVDRPKVGFSVPIAQWLRGPLRPWAEDLLLSETRADDGLLSRDPLRRCWRKFVAGHDGVALSLWAVLMLEAWRRRWIA